jgi:hypothetical protein
MMEGENGRGGEWEKLNFKAPLFRMLHHHDNHSDDFLIFQINSFINLFFQISTFDRIIQPNLGFSCFCFSIGKFGYKCFFISPLSECLSYIC